MRLLLVGFMSSIVMVFAGSMQKIDKGIGHVCSTMIETMQRTHIRRVAIGDFQTNSVKSMFERYIENEMVNCLVSQAYGRVQVIERRRLSEVLEEQKLGATGLLEKDTRAAIGKILGAGAIISGETIVTAKEAKVNVRLYAVETGQIMAAPSFTFERDDTIDALLTEPVMENRRSDLLKSSTSPILKHTNRSKQTIGYLLITVKNVYLSGSDITITLSIASMKSKVGGSVAIYAEGSDNIADFWKFFPRPKSAKLFDSSGHHFRFKHTTMKYAKTYQDWTTIQPGSEQIVEFVFKGANKQNIQMPLTLSVLIKTAMQDRNGKPRISSATLYLDRLYADR